MKKMLAFLLIAAAFLVSGCSRCVASDGCTEEGRRRVLEINVATIPSTTLRYTACESLRYRALGFGVACVISWQ
jgi:transposase-like protein